MNKEHSEQVAVLDEKIHTLDEKVDTLTEKVEDMSKQLTKYKGFVGGIIFTFSAIITGITLFFKFKTGS